MPQVFPPSSNTLARLTIVGGGLAVALVSGALVNLYRSPFVTQVNVARQQPIPFSHARHVGQNGIDCRYCHTSVEESGFAGIPTTEVCMSCHSQVLADSAILEPLRQSWENETPIVWTRVNDVPDFVYFNHSVHVAKGVGCTTCHGDIAKMPLTWKAQTMHMQWCLECHRAPENYLRDKKDVFNPFWEADDNQVALGKERVEQNNVNVQQLSNCSVCHR